jgi:hypothetical protein
MSPDGQQGLQKMLIDPPQPTHATTLAKLMQHPNVRRVIAPGEVGKAPPRFLFPQQPRQLIEGPSRRQDAQQMHAI